MSNPSDSIAAGAPLNEFQLLMRRWAQLGPYNAGHVVQVSGPADVERWRQAARGVWQETFPGCEKAGSTEPMPIECPGVDLVETIRSHLNRAFTPEEPPLRFFVTNRSPDSHWFGIMFDHWIADSHSIRQFMRRCVLRYQMPDSAPALPPLRLLEKDAADSMGLSAGFRTLPRGLIECAKHFHRHRHAFRVWLHDPADFSSGFLYSDLPGISAQRLLSRTREWGVSVNDLFLAAIAQTLGEHTAASRYASKRRKPRDEVALATAVDIRRLVENPLEDTLGCFLSYYTTVLSQPETQSLETLARHISAQTRSMKSRASATRFFSSMLPARLLWDCWPGGRELLFHKGLPLLAGISNVNLSGSWVEQEAPASIPQILDYIRISPAGPMLPMVFTLTTIGDRLSLCLTYRTAAFNESSAAAIAGQFANRLL